LEEEPLKRESHLFEEVFSFDNLYRAFGKAFKGSGRTPESCKFHFNLERELLDLREGLAGGTYVPTPYRYFKVYDPKERTISVAPFRDRVVHHALVAVLEPIFEPVFIYHSYATRKGKGTHRAIRKAQHFLKRNFYYLKMDVEKYFERIDHSVLLSLVARKIKDKKILNLVEGIVKNNDTSSGSNSGKGLPIGNLTSQFFANIYLDPLDHFVKDELGLPGYLRYMDDMVCFSNSRESLRGLLEEVRSFLLERLKLRLNPKSTFSNCRLNGLPFLGFRVFPNLIRVKKENIKRIGKRLQARREELKQGLITEERFVMSVRSMFDHVGFADSFVLRTKAMVRRAGVA